MSEEEGGPPSSGSGGSGEPTNSTAAAGTLSLQPPAPRVGEAGALQTDKQGASAMPAETGRGREGSDVIDSDGAPTPGEQEGHEPESSVKEGAAAAAARPDRRAANQPRSQISMSYDKHTVANESVDDEEVVTLPPVAATARRRGSSSAAATFVPSSSNTTATVRKKGRQTPRMPVSGRPKIGTQIAKIFPGWGLYLGQVVEIKEETYWVRYEDGEEEGFKREGIELLQTLLLYAEAEITTQVRNSRLRLREAGLMTEEEVSRAEREEEEAREEERRVKAEEEGEGGEEEGGEKEEEEVEEKEMATPFAARGSGGCTKGKHQKARKKKRHEEVVEIDGDDKDEGEVADGDVEVGEEVEDKDEKAIYLHCERCWCTFISEGGLVYHKNKDVCSQYKRKSTRNPTPEEMEGGEGGRQGLKCPVCERTFEGPNCLKYHLERAVGCVGGGREGGKKEEVEAVLLSLARPKESRKPPWRERGRRNGEEKGGEEDDADWRLREKRSKKAAALRKLMTTMVGDGMKEEEEEEEEGGEGGMKRRGGLRRRRAAIMGTTKAAKLAQREAKKKEKEESWGKKRRRVEEDGEEDGSEFSIVGEEESEEEGEEYNDEDVEGEEDQEEEEDEEGSVSVLAGNGKRRRRRFGGKEGWEGKRQMVMKGSKSRVVDSRVTVSLSGVEGLVDTGFDRGMLVVGEVEEGLRTDLKGLQLLLHHHRHHHQQQEVEVKEGGRAEEREEGPRRVHEVVDLSVWMLENGLEVASLPLKLVHKTLAAGAGVTRGGEMRRKLHPTRRFFDAREAPLPSLSSVDVIAWHPTHPHLFVAGGHDCALRLWDMRKPFRPLFEKSSFRLCACVMWLPNGVGCLAGFANGAVRILGLPEDVVKVRLYRHEAPVYDGVRGLDAVFLKGHVEKKRGGGKEEEEEEEVERKEEEEGVVIATSGGNDGNFRVMVMDKEGLIPRRMGGQMTKTCLLTLMSVRGKNGATTAAAEAASGKKEEKGDDKEDDGRLTCELSWLRAPLKGESVEVSPAGVPDAPVRAGLAVTRVIIDEEGDPFAAVGGFSGLCRFVGLRAFLK
ncbi:methylosome protein 50-like [Nannochloropsis oceanica]